MLQKTIENAVERSGVGVNLGLEVTVRMLPAPPDAGVVFVRADLRGSPSVRVSPENVAPEPRRTVLRCGKAEVQMTEHVLAAVAGLDVDNLTIEVTGPELPVGDGSALLYAEMLLEAGVAEQNRPRRAATLREPIMIADCQLPIASSESRMAHPADPKPGPGDRQSQASILAEPADEGLTLSYTLDYADGPLPSQTYELRLTPEAFVAELAPARTFIFEREAAHLIASGFGRAANPENTLVIRPDGSILGNELRFSDEFARHKVVDLLGDLRLAAGGLVASIRAVRSGHAHNLRLAEAVKRQLRHSRDSSGRCAAGSAPFAQAQPTP